MFCLNVLNSPLLKPQLALSTEEYDKVDHIAFATTSYIIFGTTSYNKASSEHLQSPHALYSVRWTRVEYRWDS